jgi:hypothetical protein
VGVVNTFSTSRAFPFMENSAAPHGGIIAATGKKRPHLGIENHLCKISDSRLLTSHGNGLSVRSGASSVVMLCSAMGA